MKEIESIKEVCSNKLVYNNTLYKNSEASMMIQWVGLLLHSPIKEYQ